MIYLENLGIHHGVYVFYIVVFVFALVSFLFYLETVVANTSPTSDIKGLAKFFEGKQLKLLQGLEFSIKKVYLQEPKSDQDLLDKTLVVGYVVYSKDQLDDFERLIASTTYELLTDQKDVLNTIHVQLKSGIQGYMLSSVLQQSIEVKK